jgi:sugar-specific transcriptional regulator TrmB
MLKKMKNEKNILVFNEENIMNMIDDFIDQIHSIIKNEKHYLFEIKLNELHFMIE